MENETKEGMKKAKRKAKRKAKEQRKKEKKGRSQQGQKDISEIPASSRSRLSEQLQPAWLKLLRLPQKQRVRWLAQKKTFKYYIIDESSK